MSKHDLPLEDTWTFLDCEKCYQNSMSDFWIRKKENAMVLCEYCTAAIAGIKICKDCNQTVTQDHYYRRKIPADYGYVEEIKCPKKKEAA
jgi:hypothetical protein